MRRRALALVALIALAAVAGVAWMRRADLPAAERGRRLAEREGCFTCHGPGGVRGAANPGRAEVSVPGFEGDLMMYAKSLDDVRAWIRDGVPPARAKSRAWQAARDAGVLRMPAWGRRLPPRDIDDLAAFVWATSGEPSPGEDDTLAARGLERAEALGCTGCHGVGGRLAPRNPGSFKGSIPSWDSRDFAELVRDRGEFEAWVRRGRSERFERDPLARAFLDRAAVRMPAFERHLRPGDVDALWAWVRWMRRHRPDEPVEAGAGRE